MIVIKICKSSCGQCSAKHKCIKFQPEGYQGLTMPYLRELLDGVLVRLRIQLDSEKCAANGWQYLPLESGLYDA